MKKPTRFSARSGEVQYLVLDLETTGPDTVKDRICEVACVGYTAAMEEVFSFQSLVALTAYGRRRLAGSNFVTQMHRTSGLLAELDAPGLPNLRTVERDLAATLDAHPTPKIGVTLAGSGVNRLDFPMIEKQMPLLASRLYHTPTDVGAFRRSYLTRTGVVLTDINASKTHRAMDDVRCHADELAAFLDVFVSHAGHEAPLRAVASA